jgi:hypothetical protein
MIWEFIRNLINMLNVSMLHGFEDASPHQECPTSPLTLNLMQPCMCEETQVEG